MTELELARKIERRAERVLRLWKKTRHRPTAVNIHDLRVAVRRLRGALWVAEHGARRVNVEPLNRDLRDLTRALGRVREIDVNRMLARKFGCDEYPWHELRPKFVKRLLGSLEPGQRAHVKRKIKRVLRKLSAKEKIRTDRVEEKIKCSLSKFSGRKNEHELRIAIKKARYALEVLGRPVKPLRNLQAALGDVHDLQVLRRGVGSGRPKILRQMRVDQRRAERLTLKALNSVRKL